ncbi:MAG TPA: hypothetical protein VMF10_16330 [Candidatus Aquilonibacter sp.]|jgi:hypothetical protein|nr:hypothetical protein [Candidatus Aquilonibacter sp.]
MTAQAAAQLEKRLEREGSVSLAPGQAEGLFDARARKLVKMSGKAALKRIRAGKCGSNLAWTELTVLSALLK